MYHPGQMFSNILKEQNTLQIKPTRSLKTEGSGGTLIEVRWQAPKTHLLILTPSRLCPLFPPGHHIHPNTHREEPPDTHTQPWGFPESRVKLKLAGTVISDQSTWNDNDLIKAPSVEERPVLSDEKTVFLSSIPVAIATLMSGAK